jgi:hypothetical protein
MGKITGYAALTAPVLSDLLPVVDVSDTSMASTGTDKKMTLAVLQALLGPGLLVLPSGDTSGATDTAAIGAAITSLTGTGNGGTVLLAAGQFYITASAGSIAVTLPAQTAAGTTGGTPVNLAGTGSPTVVYVVGNCTGISCHRTSGYGAQFGLSPPFDQPCSMISNFVLDGSLATGSAIGLDWGDGTGFDIKLRVQHFTGASTIGVQQINRVFWTEKCDVRLELYNNAQCLVITNQQNITSAVHSVEYCDYWLTLWLEAGQKGVQILHGSNAGGSRFSFRGNCSSLPVGQTTLGCGFGVFTITGDDGSGSPVPDEYSRIYGGWLAGKIEGNDGNGQGGGVYPPFLLTGTNSHNGLINTTGHILHSVGNSQITNSTIAFNGGISGDPALSAARSTW